MTLVERYILRIAFGAFAATLVGLTAVIWITQALRELDLLTSKGQTVIMFFIVTGLSLPTLVTVISPVALFIAVIYTLNRLNGDSELIVMSAAGVAPTRLLRPFLTLAGFVCFALLGGSIAGLVLGVLLLDLGVQGAQISNQSRIYALRADARSRLNTVYMTLYFIGGAFGSAIGSFAWSFDGWAAVSVAGIGMCLLALAVHCISGLRRPGTSA